MMTSFSVSEHDDDDDGVRSGGEETFAEIHGFSVESRTHFLSECCRVPVWPCWPGWPGMVLPSNFSIGQVISLDEQRHFLFHHSQI
jgi:hypothetical protein